MEGRAQTALTRFARFFFFNVAARGLKLGSDKLLLLKA